MEPTTQPTIQDLRDELMEKFDEVFDRCKEPEPKAEPQPKPDLTDEHIQLIKEFFKHFRLSYVTFYTDIGQAVAAFTARVKPLELEMVELAENEEKDLQTPDGTLIVTHNEFWFDGRGEVTIYDITDVEGQFCLKTQ